MPNWCSNEITVYGQESSLRNFQKKIARPDGAWTFQSILPEPELPGQEWYDWRVENWGTKWDLDGSEIIATEAEIKNGCCHYYFSTAWQPPLPWFLRASEIFQDLEFEVIYNEPGMGFAGKFVCRGGKVIENSSLPVSDTLDY